MASAHTIETLQQRIQHRAPLEALEEHSERIADLLERGERINSDRGLEQFVSSYLSDQVEIRQSDKRGPLCSCKLPNCSVKRGLVPPPIRIRGSGSIREIDTRRRASEWILDHPGNAAVLQEALDEYDAEIGKLHAGWLTLHREIRKVDWDRQITGAEAEP